MDCNVLCNKITFVYNECDKQDDLDAKEILINKKIQSTCMAFNCVELLKISSREGEESQ